MDAPAIKLTDEMFLKVQVMSDWYLDDISTVDYYKIPLINPEASVVILAGNIARGMKGELRYLEWIYRSIQALNEYWVPRAQNGVITTPTYLGEVGELSTTSLLPRIYRVPGPYEYTGHKLIPVPWAEFIDTLSDLNRAVYRNVETPTAHQAEFRGRNSFIEETIRSRSWSAQEWLTGAPTYQVAKTAEDLNFISKDSSLQRLPFRFRSSTRRTRRTFQELLSDIGTSDLTSFLRGIDHEWITLGSPAQRFQTTNEFTAGSANSRDTYSGISSGSPDFQRLASEVSAILGYFEYGYTSEYTLKALGSLSIGRELVDFVKYNIPSHMHGFFKEMGKGRNLERILVDTTHTPDYYLHSSLSRARMITVAEVLEKQLRQMPDLYPEESIREFTEASFIRETWSFMTDCSLLIHGGMGFSTPKTLLAKGAVKRSGFLELTPGKTMSEAMDLAKVFLANQRAVMGALDFTDSKRLNVIYQCSGNIRGILEDTIASEGEDQYIANNLVKILLLKNFAPSKVAATHFPPSEASLSDVKRDSQKGYIYGSLEDELQEGKLKYDFWFHGGTPDSKDYRIGKTRIISNPVFRRDRSLNPSFNPDVLYMLK